MLPLLAIKIHSYYSVLQSPSHIIDIVKKAYELKITHLAITDYNSISGIPELFQMIEKYNNKLEYKIIPIAGLSTTINNTSIYLYAKNKLGWQNLIRIVSHIRSNNDIIDINTLSQYSPNLICITDSFNQELDDMFETFIVDSSPPCYYIEKDDKLLQQLLTCAFHKISLDEAKVSSDPAIQKYFNDQDYSFNHIQSFNANCVTDQIEEYSLFSPPKIPRFIDSNNKGIDDADEYLTQLCRDGWQRLKIKEKASIDNILDVYTARIKEELSVIKMAGIANYFLLVKDFVGFCRKDGQSAGLRGSAVGSLIFYLIGVTDIDPVKPDSSLPYDPDRSLLFSRFINKGRFSGGRFALPDADIDIHPSFRSTLKEYIKQKYGKDYVCDIVTFSKMKGAKTIKEIFRILGLSFELANQITEYMIDEAKVQDELEDLRESNPKYNIINYCIDNIPQVKNYYDEMKYEFDLAIRLTDTITNESKHAAGIIVSSEPITNFIPMKFDGENNIGLFKMQDIEYVGGVKMDILGVLAYEKLDNMIQLINKG